MTPLPVTGWNGWADYGNGSADETAAYRYDLIREWDDGRGSVVFVMLNPSTATAKTNDPTVRRCCGFARAWGFGQLRVVNLFALRSTDPRALYTHAEPTGDPYNLKAIVTAAKGSSLVVCAWGQRGRWMARGARVLRELRAANVVPHALAISRDGTPMHPLYLRGDSLPWPLDELLNDRKEAD